MLVHTPGESDGEVVNVRHTSSQHIDSEVKAFDSRHKHTLQCLQSAITGKLGRGVHHVYIGLIDKGALGEKGDP